MKKITLALIVILGITYSCDSKYGYLDTTNAIYVPDTLTIRKEPDPVLDRIRIQHKSPWVSSKIENILGTYPLKFAIHSITSVDGDAKKMEEEIKIMGQGLLQIPLENTIPVGVYDVSIRISNDSYSEVKMEMIRITVRQKI